MTESKYDEIKLKVESILFAYGDWLSISEIMVALSLDSKTLVENSLSELRTKYSKDYPFHIVRNDDDKWKMALKSEFEDVVSELVSGVEIPKKVLKVLSVIAYEQPVTKTRLHEILGKSVKKEVDYLYKAKFVNYEKEGVGKYYKLTKKFYDYFNLEEDDDFRSTANKTLNTVLMEPTKDLEDLAEEKEEISEK